MGVEGAFLNILNAIYERSTANIILNGQKLKDFAKIRNKTRMFTFTVPILHSIESPSHSNQMRKRKKKKAPKSERRKQIVIVCT